MREYLKKLRSECNLTQQDVADKLGISLSYYSMVESGDRQKNMDLMIADKLSQALDVTVAYIIEEESKLSRDSA